jgi:hypothetical protein
MSAGAEGAAAPRYDSQWDVPDPVDPPESMIAPAAAMDIEEAPPPRGRPVLAGLLILLAVAWLGACGYIIYRSWESADLLAVVGWIATICVPLALIALLWLVFGRTGRAETERFTRAVSQMRSEAESLERVLAIVADRLAENRTQVSAEAARLMALGEEASDRLGRVTHFLSREADGLSAQSRALEAAAAQARVDLGVLLSDLPTAEQSARTFSETLREAGVAAHERALALEAQLSAITARAQDADASAGGAAERLSAHISRIESSAGVASQRIDEATARLDATVDGALGRTSEAVVAARTAIDAQAEAVSAMIEQCRARMAETGAEAGEQTARTLEDARRLVETIGADSAEQAARTLDDARQLVEAIRREASEQAARTLEDARRLVETIHAEGGHQAARTLEDTRRLVGTVNAEASGQASRTLEEVRRLIDTINTEAGEQAARSLEEARRLVETISAGIASHEQASALLVGQLASNIAALDERLTTLTQRAEGQTSQMATALAGLRDATATLRQEVDASTQEAVALVGRTSEVGGALDGIGARLREELPPALAEVEAQATAMRESVDATIEPVQALQAAAAASVEQLGEAEARVARSREALEALLAGIDSGVAHVQARLAEIAAATSQADDAASVLVRDTGPELVEALVRVREAARAAAAHAREAIAGVIPESAASLAEAAQQALGESVTSAVQHQMGELDASAQRAVAAARKASERLTRQLLALGQNAATLEARIEEEKAQRDEAEREKMPRRVALLIESLNSTAIDVTKILSNDVTDAAWQAYLKGDRGVFTRRAVRLLGSGEAREIQRHYDQEPEFREQVNRYISDFEAMLRRVLSDADGNTLAVTLLSSDMGKLYVALAQAIQHLKI